MGGDAGVAVFGGLVEELGEEEAGGGVGGEGVAVVFFFEIFFGERELEFFEVVLELVAAVFFLFLDCFELFLVVEVLHLVEMVFGFLETAKPPVEGDDAIGLGEFEEVFGAEGFEEAVAEGDEDGFGLGLLEEEGGIDAVGGGVLGAFGFAFWGFGAGGFLGVGAVGGQTLGGEGEDGGHSNFPFLGGSFVWHSGFPPGRRYGWVRICTW